MKNSEKQDSYDEVPYLGQSFPQSHPDCLATLGRLFGLSPAPITRCRVLELGCGSGGNLIPVAYQIPDSEFIGVDRSRRQVEMANKTVQDLKLQNVRIEQADILEVDSGWGMFDYIICHGVYSWVPDAVQDRILNISSRNLAPQGIAYISYNTYPGWHMRETIRHMMLFHANQFSDSTQRIEQARALMDFLGRSVSTENSLYGQLLQQELTSIKQCRDSYLFHEYLEEVNAPIYFHQFAERAGKHGLQYLAEADFGAMLTRGFPTETAETLERISQNIINAEQYMDFVRNRLFRQTLLCHEHLTLKRDLGPEDLTGLLVASAASPKTEVVNLSAGEEQSFRTPKGASLATDHALTKAGLIVLKKHWPRAIDLDTLLQESACLVSNLQPLTEAQLQQSRRVFSEHLLKCYAAGVVELHSWQAHFVTEPSDRPRISELAAYLLGQGQPVVNQRHQLVNLDPPTLHLCRILDGTRERKALVAHMTELVEAGSLVVRLDGDPLTDPRQIEDALANGVEHALANLAGAAMLVG